VRVAVGLPWSGLLSEPPALATTVAAAEQLGCTTVWSSSVGQLVDAAAVSGRLSLGFVWDEVLLPVPPRPETLRLLGRRLTHLVVPSGTRAWAQRHLPHVRVLDPAPSASVLPPGTGWAPARPPIPADLEAWRSEHPRHELVLRFGRSPEPEELSWCQRFDVDELVLSQVGTTNLDDQLQGLAALAQQVLEPSVPRMT
jgi:hypothetical protein